MDSSSLNPDRNYPALFLALDDVLRAIFDGKPDEEALQASFTWASEGFGAERAVLLSIDAADPRRRRAIAHKGLADYEVIACENGKSVPGVSTSCISEALEGGRIVLLQDTSHASGSLASGAFGSCYSVLCAPIVDARGRATAVLYLQNDGVKNAFGEIDRAWIEVYARVLGRAMGGLRSRLAPGPGGGKT